MAPKSSIILAGALVLLSASAALGNILGGFNGGFESAENHAHEEGGNQAGKFFGLDFLGGLGKQQQQQGQQQQQQQGIGGLLGGAGIFGGGGAQKKEGGELPEKKLVEKEAGKEGLLGVKGPFELAKLILNPLELLQQIATFFKLEKLGLIETVGKGLTFGLEVALQPALLSIKIIEKVFVPEVCTLKFVCDLGKPIQLFKGAIPKFSPGLLDGSSNLKALSDGIFGQQCDHLYPCSGELKLKKEFESLKSPFAGKQQNQAGQGGQVGQGNQIKGGALGGESSHHGEHQGEHFGGEHLGGEQHYGGEHLGGEHGFEHHQ